MFEILFIAVEDFICSFILISITEMIHAESYLLPICMLIILPIAAEGAGRDGTSESALSACISWVSFVCQFFVVLSSL